MIDNFFFGSGHFFFCNFKWILGAFIAIPTFLFAPFMFPGVLLRPLSRAIIHLLHLVSFIRLGILGFTPPVTRSRLPLAMLIFFVVDGAPSNFVILGRRVAMVPPYPTLATVVGWLSNLGLNFTNLIGAL